MATVNPALDNTYDDAAERTPLVLGELDYAGVTDTVCGIWEADKPRRSGSSSLVWRFLC